MRINRVGSFRVGALNLETGCVAASHFYTSRNLIRQLEGESIQPLAHRRAFTVAPWLIVCLDVHMYARNGSNGVIFLYFYRRGSVTCKS